MPRLVLLGSVLAVVLGGLAAAGRLAAPTHAQRDITVEVLAFAGDLTLMRYTFAPGARLPQGGDVPVQGLGYVESGTLTVRSDDPSGISVTRAAALATALAGGEEAVPEVANEVTVGPGDSFAWFPSMTGELRNDGGEPAVWLAVFNDLAPDERAPAA